MKMGGGYVAVMLGSETLACDRAAHGVEVVPCCFAR